MRHRLQSRWTLIAAALAATFVAVPGGTPLESAPMDEPPAPSPGFVRHRPAVLGFAVEQDRGSSRCASS
jgi:hypothetical protein